jgi:peptidyl-prolyl cis-trans isomerase B (cyclophilin B)
MVSVPRDSLDEPLTPITMDVNVLLMTAQDLKGYDLGLD